MAAADELVVIQADQRAGGGEEVGVEDDLDRIVRGVEQAAMTQMLEDRVVGVIPEVVGDDGRLAVQCARRAWRA